VGLLQIIAGTINATDLENNKSRDKEYLLLLAEGLETAGRTTRYTTSTLEGSTTIEISDELAKQMTSRLRGIASKL